MTIPLFPPDRRGPLSHICHAHGCDEPVPPAIFMCRPHWFSLRKPMRDAVWREYRRGQEIDKRPSARYLAVQQRAIAEVAFKPNDEKAACDAAPYIVKSEYWRVRAIAAGAGDPLDGLVPHDPLPSVPEAP